MDDPEAKLRAMLADPGLLQQLQGLLQAGNTPDAGMLQQLNRVVSGSRPTQQEQTLLQALRPFLASERMIKLEQALKTAKLVQAAAVLAESSANGR